MHPYISLGALSIPSFLVCLFFALAIPLFAMTQSQKICFNDGTFVFNSILPTLIGAALGGRLLFALTVAQNPKAFVNALIGGGGGSVYFGCLFGGALALAIVCRRSNIDVKHTFDTYSTYLPLGQAIGRLGCYFNGCCYGGYYEGPLSVQYPVNGVMTSVYPTWFIESACCILIFVWLYHEYGRCPYGWIAAAYLLSYSIARVLIEVLRGDSIRGCLGPFSTSQAIGFFVIVYAFVAMRQSAKANRSLTLHKEE